MSIIVSKFGGSSISDARMFRKVRDIIAQRRCRQYIILSAPGRRHPGDDKITDLLCRAHRLAFSGEDYSIPLFEVRTRFTQIIRELHLNIDPDEFLFSLEADVLHSRDRAASRGEYLCARLFAAYADLPFVDAARLIHFDEGGRIQRDRIAGSMRAMADRLPAAVIPGFYGSLPDGEIKTFTRGGSDITGALTAAALNADVYENWTDVDGLMSADPSMVSDVLCHPAVSYRQMRMLAKSGAQVLHPYCVEPVCEAGIATVLKNTFAPNLPGTYISDCVRFSVPCVCVQSGLSALRLSSLSPESRIIAEGLAPEKYIADDLTEMIVYRSGDTNIGQPASIASAFGLPSPLRKEAAQRIKPMAELHTEHCSKYLIRPEQAKDTQRALHALVLTASRTPSNSVEPCHPMQ